MWITPRASTSATSGTKPLTPRGYWDAESNEHGTGYDAVVQYPFGYGLSYTSFDWDITDAAADGSTLTKDGDVTIKVTVTNTGDRAGKDVVQLYYTAPITGEIEKSSVELGAFAKTKELQPGESEEVILTVPVEKNCQLRCLRCQPQRLCRV